MGGVSERVSSRRASASRSGILLTPNSIASASCRIGTEIDDNTDQRNTDAARVPANYPQGQVPLTGGLLREAITLVLAGQPVPEPHRPSLGCSIKWRATT